MESSNFQFSSPVLLGMKFEVNSQFQAEANTSANIPCSFHTDIMKNEHAPCEAIVKLTIELGGHEPDMPFYLKAVEGAHFRWCEDAALDEDAMLTQNAPALLLGYLRPLVAFMTAASPYNSYDIPFMNFTR